MFPNERMSSPHIAGPARRCVAPPRTGRQRWRARTDSRIGPTRSWARTSTVCGRRIAMPKRIRAACAGRGTTRCATTRLPLNRRAPFAAATLRRWCGAAARSWGSVSPKPARAKCWSCATIGRAAISSANSWRTCCAAAGEVGATVFGY